MDTTYVRERNYRMVEVLRQQNLREQRRLSNHIHSRNGITAVHRNQIAEVSKEQRKLKRELARIRKSTSSCMGALPARIGDIEGANNADTERSSCGIGSDASSEQKKPSAVSSEGGTFPPLILIEKPKKLVIEKPSRGYDESIDIEPSEQELKKLEKVRKRSIQQRHKESKKTEEVLRKFDETFPSGLDYNNISSPPNIQLQESEVAENKDEPTKPTPSPRFSIQLDISHFVNDEETEEAVDFLPDTHQLETTGEVSLPSAKRSQLDIPIANLNVDDAKSNVVKRLGSELRETDDALTLSGIKSGGSTPHTAIILTPIKEKDKNSHSIANVESSQNDDTDNNVNQNSDVDNIDVKMPIKTKKIKKHRKEDERVLVFDPIKYNPDGSVRTVHLMPNFQESLKEAMKARYLRQAYKPWFEREVTVREIFAKDSRGKYK